MRFPHRSYCLPFVLAATISLSPCTAQKSTSDAQQKVLRNQKTDGIAFHAVTPPAWLQDMTLLTYCFSVMSPQQRDRATRAGSQMSEMGFVSPFSVNYPSVILKNHDPNLPLDYIDKEIADYKKRHVRILAVRGLGGALTNRARWLMRGCLTARAST